MVCFAFDSRPIPLFFDIFLHARDSKLSAHREWEGGKVLNKMQTGKSEDHLNGKCVEDDRKREKLRSKNS